jgi:hypothetical protein
METKPKSVINNIPLGLFLALVIPVLTLIFINAEANRHLSLTTFLSQLHQQSKLSSLVSLCAIPNLGLFFLFMWKNNYKSARGVMFSTVLLVFLVFALKFFF